MQLLAPQQAGKFDELTKERISESIRKLKDYDPRGDRAKEMMSKVPSFAQIVEEMKQRGEYREIPMSDEEIDNFYDDLIRSAEDSSPEQIAKNNEMETEFYKGFDKESPEIKQSANEFMERERQMNARHREKQRIYNNIVNSKLEQLFLDKAEEVEALKNKRSQLLKGFKGSLGPDDEPSMEMFE
jgi:hypothetical protein